MEEFNSLEEVAEKITNKLDSFSAKKSVIALYAFNATGKTRLANMLGADKEDEVESDSIKVLCYDTFFEDMFGWNNEDYILNFNPKSWIIQLINEQGLEKSVVNNFKDIVNSNIEPIFDVSKGEVTFNIASGDDKSEMNIKISKGEESMFKWSIFYTLIETAIDALNTKEDDRTTSMFNGLQYIIIDDPVSSIDDTKIITMAIKLIETIKSSKNSILNFCITTHHALFYNVFVNSFKKDKKCNFESYSLSKNNQIFVLSKQGDSPFSYHLSIKELIQTAIKNNDIEKYHFNLFRNLLEKTSNFLGYNNWVDCIPIGDKQEFIRLLNLYSHSKLSELEGAELSGNDKNLFQQTFSSFIKDFKWNEK